MSLEANKTPIHYSEKQRGHCPAAERLHRWPCREIYRGGGGTESTAADGLFRRQQNPAGKRGRHRPSGIGQPRAGAERGAHLLGRLAAGGHLRKYDAAISNITVTKERKEKFDFATYRKDSLGFYVKSTSPINSLDRRQRISPGCALSSAPAPTRRPSCWHGTQRTSRRA